MRRPHVFERSVPRRGREPYVEADRQSTTARVLAAQLGNMIEKAEQAGLDTLSHLLENARAEAERQAQPA